MVGSSWRTLVPRTFSSQRLCGPRCNAALPALQLALPSPARTVCAETGLHSLSGWCRSKSHSSWHGASCSTPGDGGHGGCAMPRQLESAPVGPWQFASGPALDGQGPRPAREPDTREVTLTARAPPPSSSTQRQRLVRPAGSLDTGLSHPYTMQRPNPRHHRALSVSNSSPTRGSCSTALRRAPARRRPADSLPTSGTHPQLHITQLSLNLANRKFPLAALEHNACQTHNAQAATAWPASYWARPPGLDCRRWLHSGRSRRYEAGLQCAWLHVTDYAVQPIGAIWIRYTYTLPPPPCTWGPPGRRHNRVAALARAAAHAHTACH